MFMTLYLFAAQAQHHTTKQDYIRHIQRQAIEHPEYASMLQRLTQQAQDASDHANFRRLQEILDQELMLIPLAQEDFSLFSNLEELRGERNGLIQGGGAAAAAAGANIGKAAPLAKTPVERYIHFLDELEKEFIQKAPELAEKIRETIQNKKDLMRYVNDQTNLEKIFELIRSQMDKMLELPKAEREAHEEFLRAQIAGYEEKIMFFLTKVEHRAQHQKEAAAPIELPVSQKQKDFLFKNRYEEKEYYPASLTKDISDQLPEVADVINGGLFVPFYEQRFLFPETGEILTGTQLLGIIFDLSQKNNKMRDFSRMLISFRDILEEWDEEKQTFIAVETTKRMQVIATKLFEFLNEMPGMQPLTRENFIVALGERAAEFGASRQRWIDENYQNIVSEEELEARLREHLRGALDRVFRDLDATYGEGSVRRLMGEPDVQEELDRIFRLTRVSIHQDWEMIQQLQNPEAYAERKRREQEEERKQQEERERQAQEEMRRARTEALARREAERRATEEATATQRATEETERGADATNAPLQQAIPDQRTIERFRAARANLEARMRGKDPTQKAKIKNDFIATWNRGNPQFPFDVMEKHK